jgi:amino acid adenylation domain-containing protein
MKQAIALLTRLRALDIELWVENERLRCNAPVGVLTSEIKAELTRHKAEIIQLLQDYTSQDLSMDPIRRVDRNGGLPVSYQQQRLWFLDQFAPESALYNIAGAVRLQGALNRDALERSFREILRRHEILRTNFLNVEGAPKLIVRPADNWKVRIVSFESLPEEEKEPEVQNLLRREGQKPFDLTADPLLRAILIALNSREHVLAIITHHIASDGWSLGVFVRELTFLYPAFCENKPSPLPELPIQYVDYAAWHRSWMDRSVLKSQLPFWEQLLKGPLPVLEIPADKPRKSNQTSNGKRIRKQLGKEALGRIKQFSRAENATLFMTLLAGFKALLYRYGAGEDIIVGTATANSNVPELNDLIGFFINNLALRTNVSGQLTARQLVARVREGVLDAFQHQDVPFVQLVEALNPARDLTHAPIFQAMLILQNFPFSTLQLGDLKLLGMDVDTGIARFDLSMEAREVEGALELHVEYNTDIFEEPSITRLQRHYITLLEAMVKEPGRRIAELPMLSDEESQIILGAWNETRMEYPSDRCIHELIEEQTENSPQAEAVRFEDNSLTYAELMNRSNQLARKLRELRIGPDKLVGIYMHRSLDMAVALQAVLKAGGAYVPLDPSYPMERIAFMMQDAGLSLLLTQAALIPKLPSDLPPVLCIDRDWDAIASQPSGKLERVAGPRNLAYVIYTSGSTGKPKGVQIEHRAVVNFLKSMQREPGIAAGDCLVSVTTLSFDIAGLENYLPLIVGARIVIASRETAMDGIQLGALLQRSGATAMQATPATWRLLIDSGWREGNGLKAICGGEALPTGLADELLETGVELWNLYGPTETTIWSTIHRVRGGEDPVPIGRPIANTTVYILDPNSQPVPINVPGELHIGGDGVARGYLNRPDLTSERFVPDPFGTSPGGRLYKTGDLARYRADGTIEYLGRMDHQVKVRGYRIELGEIESVLAEHESVKQAVVVAREDTPGDQRIVGYVILKSDADADPGALRAHVSAKLPEYMVPSSFLFMESYPLTPNGKVDRRALPAPERSADKSIHYIAPRTETEEALASIWREVLKTEQVGLNDNFFDLGGHSLLVVQLQSRIRKRFNRQVTLVELFQKPTVGAMVELLGGQPEFKGLEHIRELAERQNMAVS